MALKREAILQALKVAIEGVTSANGFATNIQTVQLGRDIDRNHHSVDTPIVFLQPGSDVHVSETSGARSANNKTRRWSFHLVAEQGPEGTDVDIRKLGETILSDIATRLQREMALATPQNTLMTAGIDNMIIERQEGPDNFSSVERNVAHIEIDFSIDYHFTTASL